MSFVETKHIVICDSHRFLDRDRPVCWAQNAW